MKHDRIGILHPGEMGISIAATAINTGCSVAWASENRSPRTAGRAAKFGLEDLRTLRRLCGEVSVILSVCPPHAAAEVAREVLDCGFRGLYVDANAISPRKVIEIGRPMSAAGVAFVDGGIIGMPAWKPRSTWLYLAGEGAEEVAGCFSAGPLETEVLGSEVGRASALKMCFAALTKGRAALLAGILATAEALEVRDALYEQWRRGGPDAGREADRRVLAAAPKAWRFAGEMEEIAETFEAAGMPGGFHEAAATIFRRMAEFKDPSTEPAIEDILDALLTGERRVRPGRL